MDSKTVYNDYWSSGLHVTGEWPEPYFLKHLGCVVGKKRVLDYGCGLGFSYQSRLVRSVGEYYGADVSDLARQDCAQKKLSFLEINPTSKIDAQDAYFDAVVCSEVFEHLYDPLAAAKEIYRVLRPGGVIVATVPHFGYFAWRLRALFLAQVWDEPGIPNNPFSGVHIRHFSIRTFKRLATFAGFSNPKISAFDRCNIWHIGHSLGPIGKPFIHAGIYFPLWTRLQFLDSICPQLFAQRLCLTATKRS